MKPLRLAALVLLSLSFLVSAQSAHAWGCKGHQVVALIAESRLTPHAREVALSILTAAPIDPNLPRYCGQSSLDPFADASTWPDDVRKVRPETAPWHFIDIPRGAPKSGLAKYCPPSTSCVTSALAEQLRILRDPASAPQARADALRFVIHFVGDIHQPLHASTNNDLGGNCVPVTFFGHAPEGPPGRRLVEPGGSVESTPGSGVFNPNLHEVWDVEIIEHFSSNEFPWDLAKKLDQKFRARIPMWQSQPADFAAWAWESHQLAESVAYGRLPHPLPIEAPRSMTACPSDNDIAARDRTGQGSQVAGEASLGESMIDENLSDVYQNAAAPVVQEQLAKAGARLAALLNALWH